jgi:type II secretory pathway pseudopilin PulG
MKAWPSTIGGPRTQRGVTLVELVVTAAIGILIIAGLRGVVGTTLAAKATLTQRLDLQRQAEFAMERMVRAVANSRKLLLPLADNPATDWPEHIREQTVPASPPIGSSTLATAVLAVTLPAYSDLDFDGFPDADNDRDGRIDEDPGDDETNDGAPGIYQIDDNGNGFVDEAFFFNTQDDDESFWTTNEDPVNGVDDDGDGSVDEDPAADLNGDGCPGRCGIDDDGDGLIDEGNADDDDEDGKVDEDWYDPVVFYLSGDTLRERTPVPWDETGVGGISGRDFLTSDIATRVTWLRFERIPPTGSGPVLIDITLELTSADGQVVSVNRRVRLGGAL